MAVAIGRHCLNSRVDFPGGPLVMTLRFNAGGASSKPCALPHQKKKKKKYIYIYIKQNQYCNKFNEDF